MQIGMIGLGRMGANMATRLMRAGHECIVYDSHPEPVRALAAKGAKGATDLSGFVKELS
jgi:6-phosphogluconate dehydrogenase